MTRKTKKTFKSVPEPSEDDDVSGVYVTDREVSVRADVDGTSFGLRRTQRFAVTRTLADADELHAAVVVPLVNMLLARRTPEESVLFVMGDAVKLEAALVSSCVHCLLKGAVKSVLSKWKLLQVRVGWDLSL